MAFNPFNLFKGNPKVLELINNNQQIDSLLAEDAFISEFKKTQNSALQNYMNYDRYQQLINYITMINEGDLSNRNKSYKYPYASAQILSINNDITRRFLLQEAHFIESQIQQEVQVEKQVDSDSSQRSHSSIKSNNSIISANSARDSKLYEEEDKENFVLRAEGDKTLTDYAFSEDKQICEDDFPDVRMRRTVIVKELKRRVVKKPSEPLVLKLLDYFQKSQIIHILDGYVCKVLDNVINSHFALFLAIVRKYGRFRKFNSVLTHIESYSVQQLLLNFVSKLTDLNETVFVQQQITFLELIQIICQQSQTQWKKETTSLEDRVYILNLYALIIGKTVDKIDGKLKESEKSVQERKPICLQFELSLIKKVLLKMSIERLVNNLKQLIDECDGQSYTKIVKQQLNVVRWIIRAYCAVKKIQMSAIVEKDEVGSAKQICQSCEDCFDKLINLGVSYLLEDILYAQMEQSNGKLKRPLISKVQCMEVLALLIGQNIYFSRKTLIDNPSYDHFFILFDLYPTSSILHNCLVKLVLPFLDPLNQPALIDKFFQKRRLLSFIHAVVKLDLEIRFQKKEKSRKCYIAHITTICMTISALDRPDCLCLLQYKKSKEWQYIKEYLVEDQKVLRKKVLGGHQKLIEKGQTIFFSKEDCLNHFRIFLAGNKFNLFDDFQNYSPRNSDSQEQKDDGDRIFNFPMEEELQASLSATDASHDDRKYFSEDVVL